MRIQTLTAMVAAGLPVVLAGCESTSGANPGLAPRTPAQRSATFQAGQMLAGR